MIGHMAYRGSRVGHLTASLAHAYALYVAQPELLSTHAHRKGHTSANEGAPTARFKSTRAHPTPPKQKHGGVRPDSDADMKYLPWDAAISHLFYALEAPPLVKPQAFTAV